MQSALRQIREKWARPGSRIVDIDIKDDVFSFPPEEEAHNARNVRRILSFCDDIPHYVVNDDVMTLAASPVTQKTFTAMNNFGVLNLPYEKVLIEWSAPTSSPFCILARKPLIPTIYPHEEAADFFAYPFVFAKKRDTATMTACDLRSPLPIFRSEKGSERAFYLRTETDEAYERGGPISQKTLIYELSIIAAMAMCIAVLMTNTAGIEKVHIDNSRYDRRAAKQGKPKMGNYTMLRIGHVYDKSGKAHAYTGRHMPVHLRAGHVRNQAYGAGRTKHRMVWIDPVLVNYHPGDAVPVPHHEVQL